MPHECPRCSGSGQIELPSFADIDVPKEQSCHVCHGTGRLRDTEDAHKLLERALPYVVSAQLKNKQPAGDELVKAIRDFIGPPKEPREGIKS